MYTIHCKNELWSNLCQAWQYMLSKQALSPLSMHHALPCSDVQLAHP